MFTCAPPNLLSMPSRKRPGQLEDNLTDGQKREIIENAERSKKREIALGSILDTVGKIGGDRQVIELLELREASQLLIVRREGLTHTLRTEMPQVWRVLNENLRVDESGKLTLTSYDLEAITSGLTSPRTSLIRSVQRHAGTAALSREQIQKQLQSGRTIEALPEHSVKPIDPKSDKHAYMATTMGVRTESGRRAIQSTLGSARAKIHQLAESNLIRAVTESQVILASLIRAHNVTTKTQGDLDVMFGMMDVQGSAESIEALFAGFDYEKRAAMVQRLGSQLTGRIEFVLKLLEQEAGVDDLLISIVPGPRLARLKRTIIEKMPDSPDKENAVRVIEEALRRRQEHRTNKGARQKNPPGLQERFSALDPLRLKAAGY